MSYDIRKDRQDRVTQDHLLDAYGDTMFAIVAAEHPEACSCDADYPGWTPAMGCVRVCGGGR